MGNSVWFKSFLFLADINKGRARGNMPIPATESRFISKPKKNFIRRARRFFKPAQTGPRFEL
jgi:hypothetical protein